MLDVVFVSIQCYYHQMCHICTVSINESSSLCVGKHSVPNLVANLPGSGQSQPVRGLSEETVVSVLSTMTEVIGSSVDAAKSLRSSQGIERLVLINKDRYVCVSVFVLIGWSHWRNLEEELFFFFFLLQMLFFFFFYDL